MTILRPQTSRYWGAFASTAQLPNVAAATAQDARLLTGDTAFVTGGVLYYCTLATVGAAVWAAIDASASGAGAPAPFILNGAIDLVTPSATGTYTGEGIIDGSRLFVGSTVLDSVQMYQRVDGVSGSTTAEVYRFNAGAWAKLTLSAALTLAAGGGANAVIVRTFGPITFVAGNRISCMLTAVQARTPPATAIPTDLVITPYKAP